MTALTTVTLLIFSNIFMTFAWYGHLKYRGAPLYLAILASWGIALFEYCLQVPANRIGFGQFTGPQLKLIQEAITFSVFGVFSWLYLEQKPTFYDSIAFLFIIAAVSISIFQPRA